MVPDVPTDQDQGILPRLIATLVSRRRQVKSLMKDKSATAEQLATWDIKQLALKLTANSMYGCLGYTKSRFYARPLAVLTTSKGREILMSTKALAESMSLQVIYGDTDSVMINANVDSVADALTVGKGFKKAVNERYRLLEIDIDNIFRRILLQAKKKYAAINMVETDGKWVEKMEVKGLDMKRREYCGLSKEISSRILNEVLGGQETEVAITRIHDYLRETAAKMREGAIQTQKYIIFTQLGKAPKEYPNADSMPQVQVALRELARGKTVRKGDVISYVVTAPRQTTSTTQAADKSAEEADDQQPKVASTTGQDRNDSVARRAYTPQDVMKADSGLTPDVEWYIGKQIFPPVERLCANIVGTSTAQLAENLGLDSRRYGNNSSSGHHGSGEHGSNGLDIHPLESQIPDAIRFRDCARLSLLCRKCKKTTTFEGLATHPQLVQPRGVVCTHCTAVFSTLTIVAQVERALRLLTARYYEGWLVCDDPSCGNRTRQMSVYGSRCLGPRGLARDCLGRMRYEVSEREVYNQLVYFAGLWDVDKAKIAAAAAGGQESAEGGSSKGDILALAEHNRVRFGTVKGVVDRYLDKCGRQWVAMDTLFTKLGFTA
jgi:DNA polymerase alpha subunit A